MTHDEITYNVPLKALDQPAPSIRLMNGGSVEVMRISAEGVTVNPDIPMDDAAKYVIAALDSHIKHVIAHEREACAKVCDEEAERKEQDGTWLWEARRCAAAIRAREE